MAYHDPGPPKSVISIEVADGDTLIADLRRAAFPLGWSAILRTGASITHRGANAGDVPVTEDWLEPAENATFASNVRVAEPTPVAWLRWAVSGGTAKISIVASGPVTLTTE